MNEMIVKVVDAGADVIRTIDFTNMNKYGAIAFSVGAVVGGLAYAYGQHEKYKHRGHNNYGRIQNAEYYRRPSEAIFLN